MRSLASVSIRPSVTLVYCIHMAEDIVKFLSRSGSPTTLDFRLRVSTQLQGEPLQLWRQIHDAVMRKCAAFD